jgi:hypothetical protein
MGYHVATITKGVLGESSKIQEELEELRDAERQGVKILIECELADIYGALEHCAKSYGLSMHDLEDMAHLTEKAFQEGER